jgi:hypothetical protein
MQEKLVEPLMTDRITLEPGTTRTITYTLKDADSVHLVGMVDVKGNGAILIKTEDSMAHVRGPLAGFALAYTSPHSIDWPLFFDKKERSISFENLHDDSMTIVDVELSIEYENTVTRAADSPS